MTTDSLAVGGAGGSAQMPVRPAAAAVTPQAPASAAANRASPSSEAAAPKAPAPARLSMDVDEMRRRVDEAIDRLNDQMQRNGRDLNFSVDRVVDRTVITVRSSKTGEVVRQIPDEALLKVAHNIEQMKGLLLNADA